MAHMYIPHTYSSDPSRWEATLSTRQTWTSSFRRTRPTRSTRRTAGSRRISSASSTKRTAKKGEREQAAVRRERATTTRMGIRIRIRKAHCQIRREVKGIRDIISIMQSFTEIIFLKSRLGERRNKIMDRVLRLAVLGRGVGGGSRGGAVRTR